MAQTPGNLIIGKHYLSFNGTDVGFTGDDGITLGNTQEIVKYVGGQRTTVAKVSRSGQAATISFTLNELTLANLQTILDSGSSVSGGVLAVTAKGEVASLALVVTGPGAGGTVRTYAGTVYVESIGDMVGSKGEFMGSQVTLEWIGDAEDKLYTITETAGSGTVPAPASYQKIVSGTPSSLTDGATGVEIASAIQITWNTPIRIDDLTSAKFILKQGAGNTAIACTVTYGQTTGATDMTKVVLTPTASLSTSTAHDLIVVLGVRSTSGVASTAVASIQFTTAS